MNSPVEKIKERLSIVDVISSYIKLEKSGKNYKARCPFHNEKTPSFMISEDRNSYYCFGCGAKGDIFSFVEKFEGLDFKGSLKILADRAGIPLVFDGKSKSKETKDILYEILEEATKYFEGQFIKNTEARAYLKSRGLSDLSMSLFRVGFAPDSWRSVSSYLIDNGYKKSDLEIVGLIKTKDNDFYDRFRSRIMFPINDSSGRVIAFSGRIFGKDDKNEAKYLNSPDTPLFNKSNVLFGIDKAKNSIRKRDYSIVVEGQMDLILSHQAFFTNTVAVSGTALADATNEKKEDKINNFGLIRRLSNNVIFAFDGDDAGIRATNRSSLIALSLDMQVKTAILPKGKDPADIILENKDSWANIIKNSKNIISFHLYRICQETTNQRLRGKKIREIIFPFLSLINSSIERSTYITEISDTTGISEISILEDFELYKKSNMSSRSDINQIVDNNQIPRLDSIEKNLAGILFLEIDDDIRLELDNFNKNFNEDIVDKIRKKYEPYKQELIIQAEQWYGNDFTRLKKDLIEILLNFEEEFINEKKILLKPLDNKEKLEEFNRLSKRVEEIKQKRSI